MQARWHPAARDELGAQWRWYEQRHPGAGRRFRQRVDAAVLRLCQVPHAAALWPGVDPALGVRRGAIRGWPFAIAYLVSAGEVFILAVAHHRRRPGYWQERIPRSR